MKIHSVQDILASVSEEGNTAVFTVTEDWMQGRSVYGGLIALLAQTMMARKVVGERQLRSVHLVFAAPNPTGNVTLVTNVVREGSSVTVVRSDVVFGDKTTTIVTGVFGSERESRLFVPAQHLQLPHADAVPSDVVDLEGLAPPFFSHFDFRLLGNNFPYSNSQDSTWSALVRYKDEQDARMTIAHILGLLDLLPTPALAMLDGFHPASTLSWTVDLLDENTEFAMSDWWRIDMKVDACANGYSVYTAYLVNPSGQVTAISRQVTAIFG